jgi:hypothetical protein
VDAIAVGRDGVHGRSLASTRPDGEALADRAVHQRSTAATPRLPTRRTPSTTTTPHQRPSATDAPTVRDEEAVDSNPATPTQKLQGRGQIPSGNWSLTGDAVGELGDDLRFPVAWCLPFQSGSERCLRAARPSRHPPSPRRSGRWRPWATGVEHVQPATRAYRGSDVTTASRHDVIVGALRSLTRRRMPSLQARAAALPRPPRSSRERALHSFKGGACSNPAEESSLRGGHPASTPFPSVPTPVCQERRFEPCGVHPLISRDITTGPDPRSGAGRRSGPRRRPTPPTPHSTDAPLRPPGPTRRDGADAARSATAC